MKQLNTELYRYVDDVIAPEDVHEARAISPANAANGVFIVLALVLTIVHAFNLFLFLGSSVWAVIPIFLHLLITAITAVVTYGQYRAGMDVHHLATLAIVSAVAGIFGTLGALFGFLAMLLLRQKTQNFGEWYESIFPTDTPREPEMLYDDIVEGQDENPRRYSVMPFLEVMQIGSEDQKRRALSRMTMQFHPRLAPAFRAALHDPNNSIRVQAATAIAKIERKFMALREKIEAARAQAPKDAKVMYALAKFYDDYAFTGILDPELERNNRERAIATYKNFLQQEPNHAEAWVSIGRLMFRNQQWEDAAEWFRHALERGWQVRSMVLWYFECLYRMGHFRDLRKAIAEYGSHISEQDELPQTVRDSIALWQKHAAAA